MLFYTCPVSAHVQCTGWVCICRVSLTWIRAPSYNFLFSYIFSGKKSNQIHPAAAVRGPATTQNSFSTYSISSHLPTQYSLSQKLYGFYNIPFLSFSFSFSQILIQQLGKQLLSGKSQVLFFLHCVKLSIYISFTVIIFSTRQVSQCTTQVILHSTPVYLIVVYF